MISKRYMFYDTSKMSTGSLDEKKSMSTLSTKLASMEKRSCFATPRRVAISIKSHPSILRHHGCGSCEPVSLKFHTSLQTGRRVHARSAMEGQVEVHDKSKVGDRAGMYLTLPQDAQSCYDLIWRMNKKLEQEEDGRQKQMISPTVHHVPENLRSLAGLELEKVQPSMLYLLQAGTRDVRRNFSLMII